VAVDTGFTDYLTLNRELISRLGLMFVGVSVAELADGAEVELEEYLVRVKWGEHWREVPVLASDSTGLLGMSLLHGHTLRAEVIDGGEVSIGPLL